MMRVLSRIGETSHHWFEEISEQLPVLQDQLQSLLQIQYALSIQFNFLANRHFFALSVSLAFLNHSNFLSALQTSFPAPTYHPCTPCNSPLQRDSSLLPLTFEMSLERCTIQMALR